MARRNPFPSELHELLQYLQITKADLVAITHILRRPTKATESPREQSSPPPVATCDEATSTSAHRATGKHSRAHAWNWAL